MKARRTLLLIALAIFAVSAGGGIGSVLAGEAQPEFHVEFTQTEYAQNSTLKLPQGKAALSGTEYALRERVVFPDGRSVANPLVKLDLCGEYSLVCEFDAGGKTYAKEYGFTVVSTAAGLFTNVKNSQIDNGAVTPDYMPVERRGILVTSSASGAEIVYNSLVDLSDNTVNDTLFELIYTPNSVGNTEINYIFAEFTDYYDPSNVLTIELITGKKIAWQQYILVSAYASNQKRYRDDAHAALNVSTAGVYYGRSPSLSIALDYETLCVYGNPHPDGDAYDKKNMKFLNDLNDNPYGGSEPWQGFTTGLAYMSIRVEELSNTQSRYMLLNVDGLELAKDVANEEETVKIDVEFDGYREFDLPYGVRGESYRVFDAVAYSQLNGVIGISSVNVLYEMTEYVPVVDGRFATEKAGNYYIEYRTTSALGKQARRIVKVTARENYLVPMDYAFSPALLPTAIMDERCYLYDGEVVGGSGRVTVKKQLFFADEQVELSREFGVDYFVPDRAGIYQLRITLTDYLGHSQSFVKDVEVPFANRTVICEPVLPAALEKGKPFAFPVPKAVRYTDGKRTEIGVEIYVGGNRLSGTVYTPQTTGDLEVVYRAGSAELAFRVKVTDTSLGEPGFMKNYFVSDAGSVEMTDDGLFFRADGRSRFRFINRISSDFLNFNLNLYEADGSLPGIAFLLRDSRDASASVRFDLIAEKAEDGRQYFFVINGEDRVKIPFDVLEQNLSVKLDRATRSLLINDDYLIGEIVKTQTFERFDGFASGYAYLDILVDAESQASLKLNKIANQYFLNVARDGGVPQIYFDTPVAVAQKYKLGESALIRKPSAYDVITVNAAVSVRITAPDKTVIFEDALDGDYLLELGQVGLYQVEYIARDANGNENTFRLSVFAGESNSPEIRLKDGYQTKAEVNGVYRFTGVEVSDDATPVDLLEVRTVILDELGQMRFVKGDTYRFTRAGSYRVRYIVYDSGYNSASVEYTVTVG